MPPKHLISVPAKASDVRSFLDGSRARLVGDVQSLLKMLEDLRRADRRLACVYKLYSRGEKQDGEEMKHPRKVRLKFDRYNLEKGLAKASLYGVPDIVGLTVVVSYPSDISRVAEVIDEMIESEALDCLLSPAKPPVSTGEELVKSKYGRVIVAGGYFACHYNVSLPGVGVRPVCELQIKTVLHDAWGAKTHDLTYKPSGQTDRGLLKSFELLGSMLANLDQQSDTLRDGIMRAAGVREAKRAMVQAEILRASAHESVERLLKEGHASASQLAKLLQEIDGITRDGVVQPETEQIFRPLRTLLKKELALIGGSIRREICLLMCYLASKSGRRSDFRSAQDAIETWAESEVDDFEQLLAKTWGALAAFGAGDTSGAIELAEDAINFLDCLDAGLRDEPKTLRLAHSLISSMSYYHADRVGSHEGKLGDSSTIAASYDERAAVIRKRLGLPVGLDIEDDELAAALADPALGRPTFGSMDTCAFVSIQLAQTESEIRRARERLGTLHAKKPAGLDPLASLLFDYHDYCARTRLAELEGG